MQEVLLYTDFVTSSHCQDRFKWSKVPIITEGKKKKKSHKRADRSNTTNYTDEIVSHKKKKKPKTKKQLRINLNSNLLKRMSQLPPYPGVGLESGASRVRIPLAPGFFAVESY